MGRQVRLSEILCKRMWADQCLAPAGSLVPFRLPRRGMGNGRLSGQGCSHAMMYAKPSSHSSEDASYCVFVNSKLRKRAQRGSDKLTDLGAKSASNLVFRIPQGARSVQPQPHGTCWPRRAGDGDLVRGPGSQGLSFAASSSSWPSRTVRPEAFQSVKSTIS